MKLRWMVGVIAVLGLMVVLAACFGQAQSALDKPGTQVGDTATGPDGGTYVWVPAGEFDMGSNEGDADEEPVHHVRITRGFWLGRCTVTNAQYLRYCWATGVRFPANSDQGHDHPVVWVNWKEARAYCETYGLGLPTEAQWEYAARGSQGRRYPWGNEWDPKKCCNADNIGPGGRTFPVGSFPEGASWCGALDMAGNVWQFCNDWYDSKYYAASPGVDPPGPAHGENVGIAGVDFGERRALRGGPWAGGGGVWFRAASRFNGDPAERLLDYGFRASRTP